MLVLKLIRVVTGLSGEIVLRSLYWLSLHNPALWAVSGAGKVQPGRQPPLPSTSLSYTLTVTTVL